MDKIIRLSLLKMGQNLISKGKLTQKAEQAVRTEMFVLEMKIMCFDNLN